MAMHVTILKSILVLLHFAVVLWGTTNEH